jgi:hypothetical protein
LNASEVVAALAMLSIYSHIGIYKALFCHLFGAIFPLLRAAQNGFVPSDGLLGNNSTCKREGETMRLKQCPHDRQPLGGGEALTEVVVLIDAVNAKKPETIAYERPGLHLSIAEKRPSIC